MTGPWTAVMGLTRFCEGAVLTGISMAAQSTLLLAVGLLAGRAVRRRGPIWQALVYRTTLSSVIVGAICFIGLARHWQPLWRLSLPAASSPAPSTTPAPSASGLKLGTIPAEAAERAGPPTFSAALSRHLGGGSRAASVGAPASAKFRGIGGASPRPRPGESSHQQPERPGAVAWLYLGAVGVWGTGAVTLLAWMLLCLLYLH